MNSHRSSLFLFPAAVLAVAIGLFLSVVNLAVAQGFVPGIEDMPLAPGLTAVSDSAVVFDTPSGRIVDAQASGIVTSQAVGKFYQTTLPHLGWRPLAGNRYRRGTEILELQFQDQDARRLTVKFSLKPMSGPAP